VWQARSNGRDNKEKGGEVSAKKLFLAFIVVTMVGAFALASLAGARGRADSKVTIKGDNGDFHGKVFSERSKCLGHRTVVVYKQLHDVQKPSDDKKIGTDTTERHADHGDWAIGNSGFKKGKFYAHVKKTDACKGDFSRTITL
jgi:hypothetical protein